MKNENEEMNERESSRRDLLTGAGRIMMYGAAGAVLSACGSSEAPPDVRVAAPAAEDVIGTPCVTVLYPSGDGVTFDFDYYRDHHLTLIMDLYGEAISRFELRKANPGPDGSKPNFVATITIWIADMEAFAAAGEQHTQTLIDDVPNFTNAMPVIQNEELYGLGTS